MKRIIKYIETNYASKISIEEMADALDLSQSHFYEVFQKIPWELLLQNI